MKSTRAINQEIARAEEDRAAAEKQARAEQRRIARLYGTSRYTDHENAIAPQEPKFRRVYGADSMTMGGVASYAGI